MSSLSVCGLLVAFNGSLRKITFACSCVNFLLQLFETNYLGQFVELIKIEYDFTAVQRIFFNWFVDFGFFINFDLALEEAFAFSLMKARSNFNYTNDDLIYILNIFIAIENIVWLFKW